MVSKEVKGLGYLKKSLSFSRLVHFYEQIVDLWDEHKISDLFHLEIWFAEISLERRSQEGEIWGNIEWSNAVLTIDPVLDRYKASR